MKNKIILLFAMHSNDVFVLLFTAGFSIYTDNYINKNVYTDISEFDIFLK